MGVVAQFREDLRAVKMSAQDGTCSEGNAQQGYPSLCKNGCGFFSSVDSKGFCSVCYKDFLKKEQSTSETTEEVAATTASLSNLNVSVDEAEAAISSTVVESESPRWLTEPLQSPFSSRPSPSRLQKSQRRQRSLRK